MPPFTNNIIYCMKYHSVPRVVLTPQIFISGCPNNYNNNILFLILPVFSMPLQLCFVNCPFCFFHWKTKKHSVIFIWQIGWSGGFSTINFRFHGVIWFEKLRILWQICPLDFVSGAKLSLDSHFPNSKTPGKQKIIVSKPFVHTKFNKFV